jgi:hypothetical protein
MQAEWNDFHDKNWLEIVEYPEYALQQAEQLLTSF